MARSIVTGTSTSAGSVTVNWYGTSTNATIYGSATGASIGNPITAAYDGAYAFWVDNGHYDILNGNGATTVETRITSTNVGQEVPGTSPNRIKFDAFLGSTTGNLEAFYEGMVAGTQTLAGGTFTGPIVTTSTTNATSINTGSIITDGGAGIEKALWVGGLMNVAGVATLANATDATSINTGSIITDGGAGIEKALWVGGLMNVAGVATLANATEASSTTTGGTIITGGAGIAKRLYVGGLITGTDATASTTAVTGAIITAGGLGVAKDSFFGGLIGQVTANGATCVLSSVSENLTLSIVGATTDTTADLLPAGAIILAVTARVTTTITVATDWKLGDPTSATRFAAVNATMTAGATSIGLLQMAGDVATVALGPTQAAAAKVRVTTTGTPGAGAIRITVWYLQFVAPTS